MSCTDTGAIPSEDEPVTVAVAGREVEGVVDDVRWTPKFNAAPRDAMQIVVDVGTTTVVATPDQLTPQH